MQANEETNIGQYVSELEHFIKLVLWEYSQSSFLSR